MFSLATFIRSHCLLNPQRFARSLHSLACSLHSLPRGTVEILECVHAVNAFFICTRNTPSRMRILRRTGRKQRKGNERHWWRYSGIREKDRSLQLVGNLALKKMTIAIFRFLALSFGQSVYLPAQPFQTLVTTLLSRRFATLELSVLVGRSVSR